MSRFYHSHRYLHWGFKEIAHSHRLVDFNPQEIPLDRNVVLLLDWRVARGDQESETVNALYKGVLGWFVSLPARRNRTTTTEKILEIMKRNSSYSRAHTCTDNHSIALGTLELGRI